MAPTKQKFITYSCHPLPGGIGKPYKRGVACKTVAHKGGGAAAVLETCKEPDDKKGFRTGGGGGGGWPGFSTVTLCV